MNELILAKLRTYQRNTKAITIAAAIGYQTADVIRGLYELRKAGLVKSYGCACPHNCQTFTVTQ